MPPKNSKNNNPQPTDKDTTTTNRRGRSASKTPASVKPATMPAPSGKPIPEHEPPSGSSLVRATLSESEIHVPTAGPGQGGSGSGGNDEPPSDEPAAEDGSENDSEYEASSDEDSSPTGERSTDSHDPLWRDTLSDAPTTDDSSKDPTYLPASEKRTAPGRKPTQGRGGAKKVGNSGNDISGSSQRDPPNPDFRMTRQDIPLLQAIARHDDQSVSGRNSGPPSTSDLPSDDSGSENELSEAEDSSSEEKEPKSSPSGDTNPTDGGRGSDLGGNGGPPTEDPPNLLFLDLKELPESIPSKMTSLGEVISGKLGSNKIQKLRESLRNLNKRMSKGPIKSIKELEGFRQVLHSAEQTVVLYTKYQEDHPEREVTAQSFSGVNSHHYDALGIVDSMSKKSLESINKFVFRQLKDVNFMNQENGPKKTLRQCVDEFWKDTQPDLAKVLSDIIDVAGHKPEATGRLIIDQFILKVIRFFKDCEKSPFLFPEMNIASAKKAVVINYGIHSTLLTGTVDYAMFFTDLKIEKNQRKSITGLGSLQNLGNHEITVGNNASKTTFRKLVQEQKMYLCLVEAKKRNMDDELEKLIPQVAAESIATIEILGMESLAWCLTTGTKWIFGILFRNKAPTRGYRLTYAQPLALITVKDELVEESTKAMFEAMVVWMTTSPTKILDAF